MDKNVEQCSVIEFTAAPLHPHPSAQPNGPKKKNKSFSIGASIRIVRCCWYERESISQTLYIPWRVQLFNTLNRIILCGCCDWFGIGQVCFRKHIRDEKINNILASSREKHHWKYPETRVRNNILFPILGRTFPIRHNKFSYNINALNAVKCAVFGILQD